MGQIPINQLEVFPRLRTTSTENNKGQSNNSDQKVVKDPPIRLIMRGDSLCKYLPNSFYSHRNPFLLFLLNECQCRKRKKISPKKKKKKNPPKKKKKKKKKK